MTQLRIGIAGYGVIGKRRRICVDSNPYLKTVAVCDKKFVDDGNLEDGVAYSQSYARLFDHDLDAVLVCMSNDMAAEITIAALSKGMHVFCEKPPARNMAELAGVIEAESIQPGIKLMYGFNHRYHDSVQDALRLIKSGELGKIINMRGVYGKSKLVTFDQADWRAKREMAGGGVLLTKVFTWVTSCDFLQGNSLTCTVSFQTTIGNTTLKTMPTHSCEPKTELLQCLIPPPRSGDINSVLTST